MLMLIADELLHEVTTAGRSADPYPLYRELRERGSLHHSDRDGLWYALRYETCRSLLQDNRLGHDTLAPMRRPGLTGIRSPRVRRIVERGRRRGLTMLTANPPDHTRLRGPVNRAFTPRRVEGLRESITALVDRHLDHILEKGEADVIADLALPLPVGVISALVGVPEEGRRLWMPLLLENLLQDGRDPTEDELERAEAVFDERDAFFRMLIAEKRARPRDDMLSALVAVRDENGDRLSEEELVATVALLYFAGFVTTTNLIGNGLLALLRNPDEMARLWGDADLVPRAVEEMLRYDGPVPFVVRDVLEPAHVESVVLLPGETVVAMLGAANRDPERFERPDHLDVGRSNNHPLSFGGGIHFCLGAPLARLEGQVVFARMRERLAGIDLLVEEPPRAPGFLRGVESLPVSVRPR
jgi:cytochrome P450